MELRDSIRQVQAAKPVFGSAFYERLFHRHPALQEFFRDITMEHQASVLTMQLSVVEAYYVDESLAAENYLRLLGTKHLDRGIPPDAYPHFRDVLVESLEEFHGTSWTDELGAKWRDAIDRSVAVMLEGYEHRYQV